MAARWLLFFLALFGTLVGYIATELYLAQILFVLCAALPLFSLALSFRGMRGCRIALAAVPPEAAQGTDGIWQAAVFSPGILPLARVEIRCTEENLLLRQTRRLRARIICVSREQSAEFPARAAHCGLLELRADRAYVYDFLGLFRRRVTALPARLLCLPVPTNERPPLLMSMGQAQAAHSGAAYTGPAEDYDLRAYRPGDPIRSVHWKLSTKWDSLIVREPVHTNTALPLLLLDRFGTPEALDKLFGRLFGMSRALLNLQQPHTVLWLEPDAQPHRCDITDEKSLHTCLLHLLGSAAPAESPGVTWEEHGELLPRTGAFVVRLRTESKEDGVHDA